MARILTPEPALSGTSSQADSAGPTESDANDYELVLGRRQVASVTFLATVLLAVCIGSAYLVGRSTPAVVSAAELPAAPAASEPAPAPAPTEAVVEPAAAVLPDPAAPTLTVEKPLFADPLKGILYIQMGALEKGISEIMAEGLRKRGFESFVAPGPNDHIYRVLIGPFRSAEEYQAAKGVLDRMGLDTFARRYEE